MVLPYPVTGTGTRGTTQLAAAESGKHWQVCTVIFSNTGANRITLLFYSGTTEIGRFVIRPSDDLPLQSLHMNCAPDEALSYSVSADPSDTWTGYFEAEAL